MASLYNLEKWVKFGNKYRKQCTLIWSSPYSLCRGMKKIREANKQHFEYFKIVFAKTK